MGAKMIELAKKGYATGSDGLGIYLSEMAKYPLLTREEEVRLARTIKIYKKGLARAAFGSEYWIRTFKYEKSAKADSEKNVKQVKSLDRL